MSRTIEIRVYPFSELSDEAKERAREWWRLCDCQEADVSVDHDDVAAAGKILGIYIGHRGIVSSQGDGACFEADYAYAKGSARAIRAYAPLDTDIHAIADELARIQRGAFYGLEARTRHRGHYYHSGCMTVEVIRDRGFAPKQEEDLTRALLRFADWIYRQIQSDHDYRTSDEYVDESIEANAYEFDVTGKVH